MIEGIEDGVHNKKYYAFDWDDNIAMMPTKIILEDSFGDEVPMSTSDFAEYRSEIGKTKFEYNGKLVSGYSLNPFKLFRVEGDRQFLKDTLVAETGPAWDDFVECLNSASIFAIITARGHTPNVMKRAVYQYIIKNFKGIRSEEVYKNLRQYNKDFDAKGRDGSIQGYLDLCKFYPVSNERVSNSLGGGSVSDPEAAKVKALEEFVRYCVKLNSGEEIKVGFSDDDRKNMDAVEKHFHNEENLPKEIVNTSMTFKYTGKA